MLCIIYANCIVLFIDSQINLDLSFFPLRVVHEACALYHLALVLFNNSTVTISTLLTDKYKYVYEYWILFLFLESPQSWSPGHDGISAQQQ